MAKCIPSFHRGVSLVEGQVTTLLARIGTGGQSDIRGGKRHLLSLSTDLCLNLTAYT